MLVAGFVNFSAVCEQVQGDARPIHILCAGSEGEPSLEDTLLAGAFIEHLCDHYELLLNDSARLAWDCFETNGHVMLPALDLGRGGRACKSWVSIRILWLPRKSTRWPSCRNCGAIRCGWRLVVAGWCGIVGQNSQWSVVSCPLQDVNSALATDN